MILALVRILRCGVQVAADLLHRIAGDLQFGGAAQAFDMNGRLTLRSGVFFPDPPQICLGFCDVLQHLLVHPHAVVVEVHDDVAVPGQQDIGHHAALLVIVARLPCVNGNRGKQGIAGPMVESVFDRLTPDVIVSDFCKLHL